MRGEAWQAQGPCKKRIQWRMKQAPKGRQISARSYSPGTDGTWVRTRSGFPSPRRFSTSNMRGPNQILATSAKRDVHGQGSSDVPDGTDHRGRPALEKSTVGGCHIWKPGCAAWAAFRSYNLMEDGRRPPRSADTQVWQWVKYGAQAR